MDKKISQSILFKENMKADEFNELVIRDFDEKEKYSIEEIKKDYLG